MIRLVFSVLYCIIVCYGYPFLMMRYKRKIIKVKYQFQLSLLLFWAVLPTIIVIGLQRDPFSFMGLYVPSLLHGMIFSILGFLALAIFDLVEAYYRVSWLDKRVEDVISVPKSIVRELCNQLVYIGLPEEFVYRGFLLANLGSVLGDYWGILTSSLLFGLGHLLVSPSGDVCKAIKTFCSAIIFGIVFMQVGLIPCIIVHISDNLFSG